MSFDAEKDCHKCGESGAAWRWRNRDQPTYCERHIVQAGHQAYVAIRIDELAALVGDELTTRILRKAGYFEEDEGPK